MYVRVKSNFADPVLGRYDLWTLEEFETVAVHWPDIQAIRALLPHRSAKAITNAAARCRLRKKLHFWTAAETSKLRRLVAAGLPRRQIAQELNLDLMQVQNRIKYAGLRFSKRPYKPTGDRLKDAIRQRAFELNMTMVDLDEACGSGMHFRRSDRRWKIHPAHLVKAVEVLGGELSVTWKPLD